MSPDPSTKQKSLFPRSLLARSLMILMTPILLIQVITTFMFFDRHWNKMTGRLAAAVAGEVAIVADQYEKGLPSERAQEISRYAAQNLDFLVSFKDSEDLDNILKAKHSGGERRSIIARTLSEALDEKVRRPHSVKVDIQEKWVDIYVALENGVLQVSLPQRRLFSSSGYVFLLWMISASILLLAVSVVFMRNQIRPIRRLAVVAERLGKGHGIPARFKPEGAREVRQAAQAFMNMHERIERQIQQRTAMLAGVSHDLKTPLTRMKLHLAMMEQNEDSQNLTQDIDEMERMISSYLDFVRGNEHENFETIILKDFVMRILQRHETQGFVVETKIPKGLEMQLRPIAFERCVNNLASNSVKFSTKLRITALEEKDFVTMVFEDNGPGVPEGKYEDVLRPFFRLEESRNPKTGGVGLGLPIVQDIVLSHGGLMTLGTSKNLGGLSVRLNFPL